MSLMKSKILLNSFPLRRLSHLDRKYQFNIRMMECRQIKFKINLKNSRKALVWMKVAAEKWQWGIMKNTKMDNFSIHSLFQKLSFLTDNKSNQVKRKLFNKKSSLSLSKLICNSIFTINSSTVLMLTLRIMNK